MRAVIRFLKAYNVRAIDIHWQPTAAYGEGGVKCLMKVVSMFEAKTDQGTHLSSLTIKKKP